MVLWCRGVAGCWRGCHKDLSLIGADMNDDEAPDPTYAAGLVTPFDVEMPSRPSLRGVFAGLPAPQPIDRDVIRFYRDDEPEAIMHQAQWEAGRREVESRWLPLWKAVRSQAEGTLQRLVEMHHPSFGYSGVSGPTYDPPHCSYCTTIDDYGDASPMWPCPETRLIAADVGVELPPDNEDDAL